MKNVIKRDGTVVSFDGSKIVNAICSAMERTVSVDRALAAHIAERISAIEEDKSVEEIQDLVESCLMASDRKDVAKEYVRYRYKREAIRNNTHEFLASLKPKIEALDVQNQNANVDERSFGGRVGEATNEMMRQYALNFCMSDMARKNHLNNEIYTHDLPSYPIGDHNCISIPALETIVNYAMDKDIPYFAINVPNDTCLDCGFTGEFNNSCPACGSCHIQQLRRVTGYLSGDYKTAFNKGKQEETEMRVKHVGKVEQIE